MALFPQSFLDDLKAQTDIVVGHRRRRAARRRPARRGRGSVRSIRRRRPSFNVNKDKGFFKCFGCGAGGDVVKFVELQQKLSFPEAVRYLAQRAGIQVPEAQGGPEDRAAAAEREALVKLHEEAAAFFREQLASPAGARARRELESRALTAETIATFGYGYAPAAGRDTLHARFAGRKGPGGPAAQERSGGRAGTTGGSRTGSGIG